MSEADVGELESKGGAALLRAEDGEGAGQQALDLVGRIVAAIEQTPMVAVRSVDRSGVVRFWNHTCARLYGLPAAQALGQPLDRLLWPAERADDYAAAVEHVWHDGQPSPARDWLMQAANGSRLWTYTTMFPVYRGGELQQVFYMDVDVTARRREEGALLAVGNNFRQMVEKSSDAIMLIRHERIEDVNPAALALFDCADRARMLGRALADFSPLRQGGGALSVERAATLAQQAFEQGNCRYDWRYVSCGGRLFWAEVLLTSVSLDHEYLFYAVIRDISARKAAEHALYLAAQVFENSRDAIVLTDRQRAIIAVNRAYSDITGYAAQDIAGQPLERHRSGVEDEALFQRIWIELAASGHWQGETWALRRDGQSYPVWLSLTEIRDSAGEISNYMGILSDITERKKSEAHTRHLAEHDFLTDLPNRVLLLDRLSLALTAAHRHHSMLAILFLDLDRFKLINDTLGHHVGDLLLKEVAARLVKCVRAVDTVSRQGGDEFVIILTDIGGADQAAHVAATVLQAIDQEVRLDGHVVHVTTSIGISLHPSDGVDIDTLVRNADIAMYHAKEQGRSRFPFFDAAMNAQIVERAAFENGLRLALARQEFELEFQPEIDIASGDAVGAEALIRWRHPQFGLLAPERFIAIAEESGLMIPIGNWVLQAACGQARRWHDAGHSLVVAVNLSQAQFMQKDLLERVGAALADAALDARWLELEVTEAAIMKHGAGAQATLAGLRALGVRLTIDDFGTGYTRLGHLKDYPVDKLKIDRSFMDGITGDPDDAAVITAIIAMARSLKMQVIAEGVETAAQLDFLRQHGCDQYQGYYALASDGSVRLDGLLGQPPAVDAPARYNGAWRAAGPS